MLAYASGRLRCRSPPSSPRVTHSLTLAGLDKIPVMGGVFSHGGDSLNPVPARSLLAYLAQVPDPRGHQGRRHTLAAMLAAITCAVLCGSKGCSAIAQWVHAQPVKFWHLLGFTRTPPTENCFRDLLLRLSPEAFEAALATWIAEALQTDLSETSLEAVAIDGKSLCGTLQPHARAIHLLSAFDHQTGCTLGQLRVDSKTNEAKAALELLTKMVLQGRVITADAMFCQREVCQHIVNQGGHYLVVVKDNQPTLREAIAAEFQAAFSPLYRETATRPSR